MRWLAIAAAVLAAAACDGKHGGGFVAPKPSHGSGHGPESVLPKLTGWEASCRKAFALARDAAPFDRFAILARGCPVCSVDWSPVLLANQVDQYNTTAAKTMDVDAVVKACGGACSPSARDQFIAAFDQVKDEASVDRPWRALAKQCKGILWPAPNDRFASPGWYVLTAIGRALACDGAAGASVPVSGWSGVCGGAPGHPGSTPLEVAGTVQLPLPAAHINGAGILLTPATSVLRELPALQVTVMPTDVRVARPPTATLGGPDGMTVDVADNFPGAPLALDAIDTELAPANGGKIGLMAPIASQATRVLEVVHGIHTEAELHLEAYAPGSGGGWTDLPAMLAPKLVAPVAGPRIVLEIGGDKVKIGKTDAAGGLVDPCEAADAAAALKHAKPAPTDQLVIAIEAHAVVEQLAKAIDAAGAMQLQSVALSPSNIVKWPGEPAACSP